MRPLKSEVAICSTLREHTTDIVILYLKIFGVKKITRFSAEDFIDRMLIFLSSSSPPETKIHFNDSKFLKLSECISFWYRRSDFSARLAANFNVVGLLDLHQYVQAEWEFIKSFLHKATISLGNFDDEMRSNKLLDLKCAVEVGLQIPATLITNSKKELLDFAKNHDRILTKPIHNSHISFEYKDDLFVPRGVVELTNDDLQNIESDFSYSLFQEIIPKSYEIRIFFIGQRLFSMAIFSQNDEKTRLDYRNYNRLRPNRNVPYKLPAQTRTKILDLIKKVGLSTGSIDLIALPSKGYVFLEINPAGQFGWVSSNCNYYIEKNIAQYLMNEG